MRTNLNNDQIIPAAMRGESARTKTRNFSTEASPTSWSLSYGYLPARLRTILREALHAGSVSQIVYSYDTPIAWKDGGVLVVPDVRYSATTSNKHATHLWRLDHTVSIPWDCGLEEYAAYLSERSIYTPGYSGKVGTIRAGRAA